MTEFWRWPLAGVVIRLFLFIIAFPSQATAQCGAGIYGANTQVGGGAVYSRPVDRTSADFLVDNRSELMGALDSARSGDIIYIEDSAQIDLSSDSNILIPGGVTLASGRGRNGSTGALLFSNTHGTSGLFRIQSSDVRITGLRLRGSYEGTSRISQTSDGLLVDHVSGFEIDNCELFGWSHGAVFAVGGTIEVHHNHIHHNRRGGLGYGVVLAEDAFATVESNIFDHNRHDIAGTGDPRQRYHASYNLVLGQGTSHSFDMHGELERAGCPTGYAGGEMIVEFNTFVDDERAAVKFRGSPYTHSTVRNNLFTDTSKGHALSQVWPPDDEELSSTEDGRAACAVGGIRGNYTRLGTDYERMTTEPNCLGETGWFRYDQKFGTWYPLATSIFRLSELAFGQFNNDQKADVFRASGGRWYVSYGGTSDWVRINTSSFGLSELAFGNFIGNARTDIFRASGTAWYVSDAGRTDLFRASGDAWYVSYGGTSDWTRLASSGFTLSDLAFGNFVGDNRTDILRSSGDSWLVSDGGVASWVPFATFSQGSSYRLEDLGLADLTGDGKTDLFLSGKP